MEENQNKITMVQHLKREDLIIFNMYLATLSKNIGTLILGAFCIFFGIYGLCTEGVNEHLVYNILFIVLGVVSILFSLVFSKWIAKAKIMKKKLQDLEPIYVQLSEEGILYCFQTELEDSTKKVDAIPWSYITKAVVKKEYIYIHLVDKTVVLVIKKSDIQNDAFIPYIKEKLLPLKKYVETKK